MNTLNWWIEPLAESLKIVSFVMIIMMLMEFVSLWRHTKMKNKSPKKGSFAQLFSATGLGLIPGCVGGFTVVSLYTHGMFNFGSVLATSFTALGDDAFRMFSIMPITTLWVSLALVGLALIFGFIFEKIPYFKNFKTASNTHLEVHSEDCCANGADKVNFAWRLPHKWSFTRALLVGVFVVYLLALLSGKLAHSHEMEACATHIHHETEM
ncbi:MAG: putative manganese transporter, partial [Bacteroidales bacterium]